MCTTHMKAKAAPVDNQDMLFTVLLGVIGLYGLDYLLTNIGFAMMLASVYILCILGMAMAGVWSLLAQFITR